MDVNDIVQLYTEATDRFRLETLPQYLVPQEADELSAWRRGERRLDTPETLEWLREVRDDVARGERWWRVHVVDYPLSEYTRWELFSYQSNTMAGEEVFIADRSWSPELVDLREDFWLYDSRIAISMVYDNDGRFLRPEKREDYQRYLRMRDIAMKHSIPLSDFLRKYEPDLIADQS